MFKIALKGLRAHKLRLLITAAAIVLGVGFMAGTFVLTDTVGKVFNDLISQANSGVDAIVREKAPFDQSSGSGQFGQVRADIDPSLLTVIRKVPGVKEADVSVQSLATITLPDGTSPYPSNQGAPKLGFNWSQASEANPFEIVQGHPPDQAGQIAIDRSTAKRADLKPGDKVEVQTVTGPYEATIVGIATFAGQDNAVGATFVLLDTQEALKRLTPDGKASQISVIAQPGVSQDELVANLQRALPGKEVVSGQKDVKEQQSDLQSGLQIFNNILTGFALVSLLAGIFLIYNTFVIIVSQRSRELALLRALGAARAQVLRSVLLEALVLGLIASVVGLGFGVVIALGMKALFASIGLDLPSVGLVVKPRTAVVSLVAGLGVTILSALFPAIRAGRVPPMAALRESEVESPRLSRGRVAFGFVLLVLGSLAIASGATGRRPAGILVGGFLAFLAAILLGPLLSKGVAWLFSAPFTGRMTGRLARQNTMRNPKRTASTASALVLSITIITVFSIFFTSFGASINAALEDGFLGTFQVDSGSFQGQGLPPTYATDAAELPEVAATSGIRRGTIGVLDQPRAVYGVNAATITELLDLGKTQGDITKLGPANIAVDQATADTVGWHLGTQIPVVFADGSKNLLPIVAIYEDGGLVAQAADGHYLVDQSLFERAQPAAAQFDSRVLVKLKPGVSVEQGRAALEKLGKDYGSPKVRTIAQVTKDTTKQINQQLAFLVVLLGMSVLIGAIAIINTLVLSVFERTRELGLLRAVGMSRGQVSGMVVLESVLTSVFGTLIGFVLGVGVGGALMLSLRDQISTARVSVPIPILVVFGVVAVAIGTAAGLYPAWRASRLNVLDAISYD